jgi:serine/threonine protein kinase
MNVEAPQLEEPDRSRAATMKFTHPSGARPLDGYTIKRGVGRGGFGEVYFATSDAGKEVALKLIRRNLDVELRGVTQCLNLKHPNLIALYDIKTDNMGDQWVVMEYVSGESLEDVIERNPQGMPLEEVMSWMRGICSGVAYLHDHGIVHRDLKPGNIFSDDGTVKIGDYGLAKFISCSRRSGQTESVGTVHYMAPEIANGRYGREIDTYALGIILFEMLTGHVPFEGESVGEVLMKHLTAEPDLTALAEPYRGIVQRALAKDPDLRLKNVGELVALLPDSGGIQSIPLKPTIDAPRAGTPFAPQIPPLPSWPLSRGAALKAADAAAKDGLKRLVDWRQSAKKSASESAENPAEEPIWKFIRENIFGDHSHKANSLMRALAIFAIVAVCVIFPGEVLRLAMPLILTYVVYYIIWASLSGRDATKAKSAARANECVKANEAVASEDKHTVAWPGPSDPAAPAGRGVKRSPLRRVRSTWRDRANQELAAKPFREKASELMGSMLTASLLAAIAACVGPLFSLQAPVSENLSWYLWLAIIGTVGSWAILVPAKIAEGRLEDQVPMRLTLLILGALVGAAAWYLADVLMLTTPVWGEPMNVNKGLVSNSLLKWPQSPDRNIYPVYYIAFFAFLFVVPRWWRQTEFTRDARFSLWVVITCATWAWLLHIFWWFPQPAGMLAAGVIAFATQLASPWMPPSRRRALSEMNEGTA